MATMKRHRAAPSSLTRDEILALLKAAREHSARDWCMVLLAYRHGLRASEVCAIRTDDVDLKNQTLRVRRLKGSLQTTQPLFAHRGMPLLDEVIALRAYAKTRVADGSDFLFLSQKGGRLHRSAFFRAFRTVADLAGISADKQHPHVLKHSLATHLVQGNVNLALVKQSLGHKSLSSTMVYVETSDRQAADAAAGAMMALF